MWILPPILLLLVALFHRWRVRYRQQSSWKGGGFAMFSEIWRNYDLTELWIKNSDGTLASLNLVEQDTSPLRMKARTLPTSKNWLIWAHHVAKEGWKSCAESAHLPMPKQRQDALNLSRVKVRFRRVDFDSCKGIHRAEDIAIYEVDCSSPEKRSSS